MLPILVVLAYLECDGRVLLARRPSGTPLAGYWEFPGGKVEPGETMPAALIREVKEEIDVTVSVGTELAATRYNYPDRDVELHLFRCTLQAGAPVPRQVAELRWVPKGEIDDYAMPEANTELLAVLTAR